MNINDFKLPEFKTYVFKIANDFSPITYFDEVSLITYVAKRHSKNLVHIFFTRNSCNV